jgi:hypothetical protein
MRIGREGPYSDFGMCPPSHHPEEDTENNLTKNQTLPPARGRGLPHLQDPKATRGGAERQLRRRGDGTLDGFFWLPHNRLLNIVP